MVQHFVVYTENNKWSEVRTIMSHSKHLEKGQIRRSIIHETIRNIDGIAAGVNEGKYADQALMVKLINRMIAFLNEFVKPKEEVQDGHGINSRNDSPEQSDSAPAGGA
jgi:hypothetical protein